LIGIKDNEFKTKGATAWPAGFEDVLAKTLVAAQVALGNQLGDKVLAVGGPRSICFKGEVLRKRGTRPEGELLRKRGNEEPDEAKGEGLRKRGAEDPKKDRTTPQGSGALLTVRRELNDDDLEVLNAGR